MRIAGINSSQATYTRIGTSNDVRIGFANNATDSILLSRALETGTGNSIETILFSNDNVTRTADWIRATVLGVSQTSGNDTITAFSDGAATINGGLGNDSITGSSLNDSLLGGNGLDTIRAGAGNDVLDGGMGNDSLFGDADLDSIRGGGGADSLVGGRNNDTYFYVRGDGADTISDTGNTSDSDSISISNHALSVAVFTRVANSNDFMITFTGTPTDSILVRQGLEAGGDTLEQVTFASGGSRTIAQIRADVLAKQVTTGNDTIIAFTGVASTINGGAGNDSITGSNQADSVIGDAGNDTLNGSFGVDTLTGGVGVDVLAGGSSGDRFVFNRGDTGIGLNNDRITDFSRTQGDKIALLGYGLSASGFRGTGAMAAGGAVEFGFSKFSTGNYTLIRIDADNNGVSDQEIWLTGVQIDLVASDFLFV